MTNSLLFSGSSNFKLAEVLAQKLKIKLGKIEIKKFSDGETYVNIKEVVKNKKVLVLQSGSYPVNENLMELFLILDALKRLNPQSIITIIPFYPYRRQERKVEKGEPVSAELVARLLKTAGADKIIVFDIHHPSIIKFFKGPFINIEFSSLLIDYFKKLIKKRGDWVVVSPDEGALDDSRRFAKVLHLPVVLIKKSRQRSHDVVKKIKIVREKDKIKGRNVLMIDDEINTAGTLVKCVSLLKEMDAGDIYMAATHPVLSSQAIERLRESPIKEIVVSDTINLSPKKRLRKIKVLSVANLLAKYLV